MIEPFSSLRLTGRPMPMSAFIMATAPIKVNVKLDINWESVASRADHFKLLIEKEGVPFPSHIKVPTDFYGGCPDPLHWVICLAYLGDNPQAEFMISSVPMKVILAIAAYWQSEKLITYIIDDILTLKNASKALVTLFRTVGTTHNYSRMIIAYLTEQTLFDEAKILRLVEKSCSSGTAYTSHALAKAIKTQAISLQHFYDYYKDKNCIICDGKLFICGFLDDIKSIFRDLQGSRPWVTFASCCEQVVHRSCLHRYANNASARCKNCFTDLHALTKVANHRSIFNK